LLQGAGLQAKAYHAGISASNRASVQSWWTSEPKAVVVATLAFGMGIDAPDVRAVVHWDAPKSIEGLY